MLVKSHYSSTGQVKSDPSKPHVKTNRLKWKVSFQKGYVVRDIFSGMLVRCWSCKLRVKVLKVLIILPPAQTQFIKYLK